ncbi:MAG: hypothetical protein K5765_05860 [Clostridia bacterium]|nr:hypothetical protein [Clostridia bacterium]
MEEKKIILFVVESGRKLISSIIADELNKDVLYQGIIVEDNSLKNAVKRYILKYIESPRNKFEAKISYWVKKRKKYKIHLWDEKSNYLRNKSVINMIYRYAPSAVVTNSHECLPSLIRVRKETGMNFQLFVMPDEMTLNLQFKDEAVDHYFVDNFDMRSLLMEDTKNNKDELISIEAKKISITALPIEDKYFNPIDKEKAFAKLKVPNDMEYIVIFSRHIGDDSFKEVIDYASKASFPYRFAVFCGNNKSIFDYATQKGMFVFGENADIYDVLSIAKVVVGRPTMALVKNCMALGIDVIAMNPLGKRERENMNYLLGEEIIKYAEDVTSLDTYLHESFNQMKNANLAPYVDKSAKLKIANNIKLLTKNVIKNEVVKKDEQL